MDSIKLDTSLYDVASRIADKVSSIINVKYEIKALGHHIEFGNEAVVDLYPRGRYILMRVTGPRELRKLIFERPARFVNEGITRYFVYIPGEKIRMPEYIRHGRLNIFGYTKYKNGYYLVTAHRSHIRLAETAVEKYVKNLNDDAVLYGLFDLSARTPAFTLKRIKNNSEIIQIAEEHFDIIPTGCLESNGAGTVVSIISGYSLLKHMEISREELLGKIVKTAKIRVRKTRK